ncbi:hypothetical protein DAMA08_010070 [Martiniozyma asiatica (nom. inval.)]|nr:hypothetical protein DAMA08_010070 [Martiniozyma asiatica]
MTLSAEQIAIGKKYDLTEKFITYLDRHLINPLLENLELIEDAKTVGQAEYELLKDTYMTNYVGELYMKLNPNGKIPDEITNKEKEISAKLEELNKSTKITLDKLVSSEVQDNLKQDKNENRQFLKSHGIDDAKINELFELGQLQFNRGDYITASDLLNNFKLLSTDQNLLVKATWGRLVCEINNDEWVESKNEMTKLRDVIDNRNFQGSTVDQLKFRTWLIHYALFIYFNSKEAGLSQLVDLFMSSSYLSTVEAACPWILRYISVALLYSGDFKKLKELLKAIEVESYEYQDPFTNLLATSFTTFKFEQLNEIINEIKVLVKTDYFISKLDSEKLLNVISEIVLSNVVKIYQGLTVESLQQIVNIDAEQVKKIVESSESIELSADGVLTLKKENGDLYYQVYEKTKALNYKSTQILGNAFNKE